jgi:hypothetical protein
MLPTECNSYSLNVSLMPIIVRAGTGGRYCSRKNQRSRTAFVSSEFRSDYVPIPGLGETITSTQIQMNLGLVDTDSNLLTII